MTETSVSDQRSAPPHSAPARQRINWPRPTRMPKLYLGLALMAGFVLMALFAPLIVPHDPYAQSLLARLKPPVWAGGTWEHPFGTDGFGRDYLSRLIHGSRISIAVGFFSATLAMLIGLILGISAGVFGGVIDRVVSFIISVRLALPSLLLALAVLQLAGSGLWIVVIVLAITHWDRFAVVLRTTSRQVASQDFVTRARAMGASEARIIRTEILPNVSGQIVIIFTFEMAQCILAAAALSFLGMGIQAPEPSWGLMMSEGRKFLVIAPWLITIAGLALMLLVLAVNLVGEGLRAWLTPKGRST